MTTVRVILPIERAGRALPVGYVFVVDEDEAVALIDRGLVERVSDEASPAETPAADGAGKGRARG